MKALVIAEKPSVGRDIARVLGCKEKKNGEPGKRDPELCPPEKGWCRCLLICRFLSLYKEI